MIQRNIFAVWHNNDKHISVFCIFSHIFYYKCAIFETKFSISNSVPISISVCTLDSFSQFAQLDPPTKPPSSCVCNQKLIKKCAPTIRIRISPAATLIFGRIILSSEFVQNKRKESFSEHLHFGNTLSCMNVQCRTKI